MFPMKFDHKTLETLPVPDAAPYCGRFEAPEGASYGKSPSLFQGKSGGPTRP